MEKDDKGYYIMSNHASLFMPEMKMTYGWFLGAIGGAIDGIRIYNQMKRDQAKEKSKYYIDHLTGYYMLEEK